MNTDAPPALRETLRRHHQEHLLQWWGELSATGQEKLRQQIEAIDFAQLARLTAASQAASSAADETHAAQQPAARTADAVPDLQPPQNVVSLPSDAAAATVAAAHQQALQKGREWLAAGRVGAVLVAGGQGSRLGFPHPKGMFPIGPVTQRSLFQLFAEQLQARIRSGGGRIPLYVMTSHATHEETVAFFREQKNFGLNPDDVFFFQQGALPAVDVQSGRILMQDKASIALSPDGHGGLLAALQKAGLLEEMRLRGIEALFYFQVDNPATVVCDPLFLGYHRLHKACVSVKVAEKRTPEERMGVVACRDGKTCIVEYSDLPAELALQREEDGSLAFRAGNTAIHVFRREFLERMAAEASLPFHFARKKVPFINEEGRLIQPEEENAWKFERFIFDVLPLADNVLVMEIDRDREFLPVKNAGGADSPATARAGLIRLYSDWLRRAGVRVKPGTAVEISPLFALDAAELGERLQAGAAGEIAGEIAVPTVFGADGVVSRPGS